MAVLGGSDMNLTTLKDVAEHITPANQGAIARAKQQWDRVVRPLGNLGLLEEAIVRAAGASGDQDVYWERKAIAVFCADNGVVEEGVTQNDQEVTALIASSMARGEAFVCRMAWSAGAEVFPVDIGLAHAIEEEGILRRHVLRGTRSIAKGPAMTHSDAMTAIMTGVWLAEELVNRGYRLLAAGEIGIGNTTTAAAVAACLLGVPAEIVIGCGNEVADQIQARKVKIIKTALYINQPNLNDPVDVLAKVGSLDIAAMAGFYLGCALKNVPVVLDGAVSCTAALAASRICPDAAKSMIASHLSANPCGKLILDELNLKPFITAKLRLGEGSGAVAAMPMLDMALSIYRGAPVLNRTDSGFSVSDSYSQKQL